MVSAQQLRAGRALIGWSQADLAAKAGVSVPTLKRLESGKGPGVSTETRQRVAGALEAVGVIFVAENGEGPGVRMRKGVADD